MSHITTREELKDHIHNIHNYMRNKGIGYGMQALKVFMVFYALKLLEAGIDSGLVNLPKDCKFSHFVHLINGVPKGDVDKKQEVGTIIIQQIHGPILDCFGNEPLLKHILFVEFPKFKSEDIYIDLVNMVDKIPINSDTYDVAGKMYEYFIGREKDAISSLGAYFTDRHITNFIMDRIKPQFTDNKTIPTMIDPFGGSGGFSLTYISHFINLAKLNKFKINWKVELMNIFHCDVNDDVIRLAGLEMFSLTHVLPKKGLINGNNNLIHHNSFTYEAWLKEGYDYVITNPPYGGDKTDNTGIIKKEKVFDFVCIELNRLFKERSDIEEQLEGDNNKDELEEFNEDINKINNKIKILTNQKEQIKVSIKKEKEMQELDKVNLKTCSNYIRQYIDEYNIKAKKNNKKLINANDKEACSLVLIMKLVKKGGVGVGVLKEGVFFDKKYEALRHDLIENYVVMEIISVPADQFENTSTKTSIIIFRKPVGDERTTTVKFSTLGVILEESDVFDYNDKGKVYLKSCSGEIKEIMENDIKIVDVKDIIKEGYCFNGKKYNTIDMVVSDDYKLVKLGDICEIEKGNMITISNLKDGIYPVIGGGKSPMGFHNKYNREENTILLSASGNYAGYISRYPIKVWASDCISIKSNNKKIHSDSIYNILINHQDDIYKYIKGNYTCQPHLKVSDLQNFKIPIPKSTTKLNEWTAKLMKPYDRMNECKNEIKQLEKQVIDEINRINEEEDCEKVKLGDLCEINSGGTPNTQNSNYYSNGTNYWVSVKELNNRIVYDTEKKNNRYWSK